MKVYNNLLQLIIQTIIQNRMIQDVCGQDGLSGIEMYIAYWGDRLLKGGKIYSTTGHMERKII